MENTPQKGVYRWIVFKKGRKWVTAALEFNIVEVGDDPNVVLFELQEAAMGYIEATQKINGFRPQIINRVINQKSEEEYERLWSRAQRIKQKRSALPHNVFDFGARNLAAVS